MQVYSLTKKAGPGLLFLFTALAKIYPELLLSLINIEAEHCIT